MLGQIAGSSDSSDDESPGAAHSYLLASAFCSCGTQSSEFDSNGHVYLREPPYRGSKAFVVLDIEMVPGHGMNPQSSDSCNCPGMLSMEIFAHTVWLAMQGKRGLQRLQ